MRDETESKVFEKALEGHEKLDNERFTRINGSLTRIEGILWACAGTLIVGGAGLIWTLLTSKVSLSIYAMP